MGQDIIEMKSDQTYENYRGVVRRADDVQVFGNEKAHDGNLHEVMECTRKKQALNVILINEQVRPNVVVSFQ